MLLDIIDAFHNITARLIEVVVIVTITLQLELRQLSLVEASQHLVERVVVSFPCHLVDNADLLKQIVGVLSPTDFRFAVKEDLDIFAKTRAVVVANGLGIPKGFKNRIGVQDALLHASRAASDLGKVLQRLFRALRFASTTFTTDHDGLSHRLISQILKRVVGNIVDMRWNFSVPLLDVHIDDSVRIQREALIRIARDQDRPHICVNLVLLKALFQIVQNERTVHNSQQHKVRLQPSQCRPGNFFQHSARKIAFFARQLFPAFTFTQEGTHALLEKTSGDVAFFWMGHPPPISRFVHVSLRLEFVRLVPAGDVRY
mmetsp:Transcript_6418/g.12131  ORF Transcript_6418/g.12131 Transcript_6418/m.12131 type:complete len:315 (+) Transcript_6418:2679-3623(+)